MEERSSVSSVDEDEWVDSNLEANSILDSAANFRPLPAFTFFGSWRTPGVARKRERGALAVSLVGSRVFPYSYFFSSEKTRNTFFI
jgi:hypothetical protein